MHSAVRGAAHPHAARHAGTGGMALLAVLFALTLLMMLTLPFAVSMTVGADAAMRDVEETAVQQATASARELLLSDAALSHPSVDPTPGHDDLDEYPAQVDVPKAFAGLTDDGRVLLGGQVEDLQRYLQLDSASPLLFANAIGVTTRLRAQLEPGARTVELDDASNLPDTGVIWVANELIRYGSKDGNVLGDLERAVQTPEFADGKQPIAATALVLDYRCVMAAAWPFLGGDGARKTRRSYRAVGEVLDSAKAGFGSFTAAELDAFERVFDVDTMAATAATWGRPERVFGDLKAGESKTLAVKSALHLGPGSTVRLRNLRTGDVEYGLVMQTGTPTGTVEIGAANFHLQLLFWVAQDFPAIDTVVEPLIPAPVNVNTAPVEVLTALCTELRPAADVRVHEGSGARPTLPRSLGATEARQLAEQIVELRRPSQAPGQGAFTGWRDLVERLWKPRLDGAGAAADAQLWVAVYRNLATGRDSALEMGTAPLCFQSGPWVRFRAAASRSRSRIAPGVVARHERTGIAAALPGFTVQRRWATQEDFEEAFALDRRGPFWTTNPINVGALLPLAPGNDPAGRYAPHLFALAYPTLGLGEQRFAATDDVDAGCQPAPATALMQRWPGARGPTNLAETQSFAFSRLARGHDLAQDGPFVMTNTGPKPGASAPVGEQGRGRHDRISFPFANQDGYVGRFGVSFWAEPQTLANAVWFDHSDGDPDRNRLSLQVRDGNLLFESIDEAGLDPAPSDSPAGIERTASEWTLPLTELGLPADTPVHVSMSAMSGRPGDLSVAIDGVARGKAKYVTTLTSALKVFDPTLGSNRTQPGAAGNERWLDVQVESTEGFPPVGVLRIGLELFEYSAIQGNSFRCRWTDSVGGRGSRQVAREHRPDIPADASGKPRIDINDAQFQGANLDVFPAHPAGAQVELYGYSAVLSEDTPMMVGSTQLDGAIGGWAVARGYIDNPRAITVQRQGGPPIDIGMGIDETWVGDVLLADPIPTGDDQPPPKASDPIANAFSTSGGYALLVQRFVNVDAGLGSTSTSFGGVELVRYTGRQGNKLSGVQRAQQLPGQDGQIGRDFFDGRARKFVTEFDDDFTLPNEPGKTFDDVYTLITFVVPVSLGVASTASLWDPQSTGLTEWVQLYPRGGDVSDTEWVRYDAIAQNKYLVRANRAAWDAVRFALTDQTAVDNVQTGPLGPTNTPVLPTTPPWPPVTATTGYIGYVPQIESTFPQIQAARYALRFRGDPMNDFYADGTRGEANQHATSSHAHSNSLVTQCHRLQLLWGNYGAYTGRTGRHDRVALLKASGDQRDAVEWHTVNWAARRFNADNLERNQTPPERLGPWPFQLVAFQAAVTGLYLGPPTGTVITDSRRYDRVVKFPSGELPAAHCAEPVIGSAIGNAQPMRGVVDEVEVVHQIAPDALLDEEFGEAAKTFRINPAFFVNAAGAVFSAQDVSAEFPEHGGLVWIDGEILAYQQRDKGLFTVAENGRALLGTEARAHDRGARVRFLSHRPAAILAANVGARDAALELRHRGALPRLYGTVLLGRELLHYAWVRDRGDVAALEMPRWYPPGEDGASSQSRGLFRGRFGTTPQAGVAGEPLIGFPFRYWDRHVDQSDDPELAYFQLTTNEAPVFFRGIRWRQETTDPRVEVVCIVRADSRLPWSSEPSPEGGLWHLRGGTVEGAPHKLGVQASRLEVRFVVAYRPGCIDLATFRAHAWKSTARVEDVQLEYEGQTRVLDERVTAR